MHKALVEEIVRTCRKRAEFKPADRVGAIEISNEALEQCIVELAKQRDELKKEPQDEALVPAPAMTERQQADNHKCFMGYDPDTDMVLD